MTERFQLLQQVGRGGMGIVWKARDTQTGEFVALKIPWEQYATDPAYVERLEREVEVTRRIDSPYVAKILGFGRREGRPFIAMEYVDGKSLRDLMDEKSRFTWDEAKPILRQVALGLDAAHKANVIHRDVKPSNILLTGDGTAKLVDFGIARAADMAALTGSKTTLGTPAYMAPEGTPSPQADLYGLGCVAYEMLTGRQVFDGDTQQEVIVKHIRVQPDILALPAEARSAVGWLLRKRPEERPRTAGHAAQRLEVGSSSGNIERPSRRIASGRRVAVGALSVCGILLGGLGLLWAFGGMDPEEPCACSPVRPTSTVDDGDGNATPTSTPGRVGSQTPQATETEDPTTTTQGSAATPPATPTPPAVSPSASTLVPTEAATATPTPTSTLTPTPTPPVNSGFSLSLSASHESRLAGQSVTITAVSNRDIGPTPYFVEIYEDGYAIERCGGGNVCTVNRAAFSDDTRVYVARIVDFEGSNAQATSMSVIVRWTGTAGYSVSLSASPTTLGLRQPATITARAGFDITQTPYWIVIYEDDVLVEACGFSVTCSIEVAATGIPQSRTYHAVVADSDGSFVQATSNAVTVTWTGP